MRSDQRKTLRRQGAQPDHKRLPEQQAAQRDRSHETHVNVGRREDAEPGCDYARLWDVLRQLEPVVVATTHDQSHMGSVPRSFAQPCCAEAHERCTERM